MLTELVYSKIAHCTVLVSKGNDSYVAPLAALIPQTCTRHSLLTYYNCRVIYYYKHTCGQHCYISVTVL